MGGKVYGFSDAWARHADMVNREGIDREGVNDTERVGQTIGKKSRMMRKDAAIGLESVDVHHGGDRVVIDVESPQKNGDIIVRGQRYDDNSRFRGTMEYRWVKVAEGKHVLEGSRRVYD